MIDVEKIRATSSLAKSLVEKGFATNIEEACVLIERQGLVDYEDNLPFTERQKQVLSEQGYEAKDSIEVTPIENPQTQERVDGNEILRKIERMESMFNQMKAFMEKYCANNDNNLRELDQGVKKLKLQVSGLRSQTGQNPQETQSTLQAQEAPKSATANEAGERNGALEGVDQSQFAVDKIFNNSNGQLMGRLK